MRKFCARLLSVLICGNNVLFIAISITYILPFLASQYFWWLIMLFPLCCIYGLTVTNHAWWQVLSVAFFCISMQQCGLIISLYYMASGIWYIRLMPGIFFICYIVLSFFCIWLLLQCLQRCVGAADNHLLRILFAAAICILSLYYHDHYCFIPFGSMQGYPFCNPLMPLAERPELLWPLSYLGVSGMSACLWALSAAAVIGYMQRSYWYRGLVCVWYGIWIVTSLFVAKKPLPAWIDNIVIFQSRYAASGDATASVLSLTRDIHTICKAYPQAQLIVMPESALSRGMLDYLEQVPQQLPCTLLAGGYKIVESSCYNTLLYASDNSIILFSKRSLVPMIECIPRNLYNTFFQSLFFSTAPVLTQSNNQRLCYIRNRISFIPYICSELFLSSDADDQYNSFPIIVCVNDTWCAMAYVRRCMQLCARLRAIAWGRDIVYAAYYSGLFISQTGKEDSMVCV